MGLKFFTYKKTIVEKLESELKRETLVIIKNYISRHYETFIISFWNDKIGIFFLFMGPFVLKYQFSSLWVKICLVLIFFF